MAIPMIWERIGRKLKNTWQIPKAVFHVDANLSPEDIKLAGANESKVVFLHTGTKVGKGIGCLGKLSKLKS